MRVISFFSEVRVREVSAHELRAVDPELTAFENLNTPEDLQRASRRGSL